MSNPEQKHRRKRLTAQIASSSPALSGPLRGQNKLWHVREDGYAVGLRRGGTALIQTPAILEKWLALRGPDGPLGLPVDDELPVGDTRGRLMCFEYGAIYMTKQIGVHAVYGPLYETYMLMGGALDILGYPLTDVLPAGDGGGDFCHFEWGTLYSPDGRTVNSVLEPLRSTWLILRAGPGVLDQMAVASLQAGMPACQAMEESFLQWAMSRGVHSLRTEPGDRQSGPTLGSDVQ